MQKLITERRNNNVLRLETEMSRRRRKTNRKIDGKCLRGDAHTPRWEHLNHECFIYFFKFFFVHSVIIDNKIEKWIFKRAFQNQMATIATIATTMTWSVKCACVRFFPFVFLSLLFSSIFHFFYSFFSVTSSKFKIIILINLNYYPSLSFDYKMISVGSICLASLRFNGMSKESDKKNSSNFDADKLWNKFYYYYEFIAFYWIRNGNWETFGTATAWVRWSLFLAGDGKLSF